jgi:XRE family transcriptional regulator, regulator of sulfur utilization
MKPSRRDLTLFVPGMLLAQSEHSEPKVQSKENSPSVLKSAAYDFNEMPVRASANGMKSRAVFNGVTGRGQRLTMHISELGPHQAPHPPERQPHEEVVVILEGTLEVTLNGETKRLGPGSVIYSGFNDLNGWKNIGDKPARYTVLSLEQHL